VQDTPTADLQLDTLEAKGLIRLATIDPELEYLFRHALVQDAAYESLLKQERRSLHRTVGEIVEELYPERVTELAAVLAMHFEQAGDTERALRYLLEAAKFAKDRNALVEAYDLYGRAEALLPPASAGLDDESRRRRIDIGLGKARAGFTFLGEGEVIELLKPTVAEAEELGDPRLAAEAHLMLALMMQFRGDRPDTSPELRYELERSAQIADELGDPVIAALPKSIIGLSQIFTGDLHEGVETLEEAAPLLEQKHDFVGSSFALVALSIGYSRLGQFELAAEAARRASEVGEKGDVIAKLDSMIAESTVRSLRGDLDAAVPLAMQCTALSESTGATACVVASNFVLGDAYMRQGKFGDAKIAFERGNEVANAVEQRVFRPSIAAYMRSAAASMGDFGPNTRTFEEALAETREHGDRFGEANVIWKRAETESKRLDRNREHMLADFAAAAGLFEQMDAKPFIARVLRGWGQALLALGQTEEGDQKLRRAVELFDQMGIEREAGEIRAMLANR
jgi:tetratricopeptide (TPR) repeat protein